MRSSATSYYRFLGRGQRYGLSARGLAIGAGAQVNEEFPFFREFWIETPDAASEHIVIHALLDGASATGAFRFDIFPGLETSVDASVTLFARKPIASLGMAPLSSMFLCGKNDHRFTDDSRGELHDSDGLLMHTGAGEWIWRPLSNPAVPAVSTFIDNNPRGFGLLQRDRNFDDYQDLDLAYELRPTYWIEPREGWGEGGVQLVELPTEDESNDNIVAAWAPKQNLDAGASTTYGYRITALTNDGRLTPGARAVNTFRSQPRAIGAADPAPRGSDPLPRRLFRRRSRLLPQRPHDDRHRRHDLRRARAAHLPRPQHPRARFSRGHRRRGRPRRELRSQGLPALGREGADGDVDVSVAGVRGAGSRKARLVKSR